MRTNTFPYQIGASCSLVLTKCNITINQTGESNAGIDYEFQFSDTHTQKYSKLNVGHSRRWPKIVTLFSQLKMERFFSCHILHRIYAHRFPPIRARNQQPAAKSCFILLIKSYENKITEHKISINPIET